MDGALLIDKREGYTSTDIVNIVKEKLKVKAGHTGTLDPIATGLLIVLLGRATRFARFLSELDKSYKVTAVLGEVRDTYDRTGEIVGIHEINVTCDDVAVALEKFIGEIEQKPPPFSAKRIKGARAYDLARKGIKPDLKPVRVTVHEAKIINCKIPEIVIFYRVSSGTYIRSLIHDLGLYLGTGAYVQNLRREAIGNITVDKAVDIQTFMDSKNPERYVIDVGELLNFMEAIRLSEEKVKEIYRGKAVVVKGISLEGKVRLYADKKFIGVGEAYGNIIKPLRLLPPD